MPVDLSLLGIDDAQAPVSTLCALFDHAVATAPETVGLRHLDTALTWREMGRAVWALARRLAEIVAPGDVVALVLPNSIEFHIAYFAALKALAAPGLLNPLYPAVQLAPLLRDTVPRAILCVPANRDTMAELARELGIPGVICIGQDVTMRDLVAEPERPVGLRDARPDDPRSAVVQRRHHRNSQGCRAHAPPARLLGEKHGAHFSAAHGGRCFPCHRALFSHVRFAGGRAPSRVGAR